MLHAVILDPKQQNIPKHTDDQSPEDANWLKHVLFNHRTWPWVDVAVLWKYEVFSFSLVEDPDLP